MVKNQMKLGCIFLMGGGGGGGGLCTVCIENGLIRIIMLKF